MAAKNQKSATKKTSAGTKVTRIKVSDTKPAKKEKKVIEKKAVTPQPEEAARSRNPLKAIGGYFAGAWYELKQVRWPNRKATWGLTLAVLGFTAFFVVLILLLDAFFKYIFQLILG